jgi:hypothetical protein
MSPPTRLDFSSATLVAMHPVGHDRDEDEDHEDRREDEVADGLDVAWWAARSRRAGDLSKLPTISELPVASSPAGASRVAIQVATVDGLRPGLAGVRPGVEREPAVGPAVDHHQACNVRTQVGWPVDVPPRLEKTEARAADEA